MQNKYVYLVLIVIGIALIAFSGFNGNTANFDENGWYSYDEGLRVSRELNKPMLIFISSPTCPFCLKMREDILSDSEVKEYINTNFVPVYIDVSKEKPPFNVFSYPTFVVFYNGKVIDSWAGYAGKELFLKKLKSVKV
ncbi:hypothetical protein DRP05_05550 [Archaeoglobales archaeon]|nr:MAG: hypothetical protein DRP05_05550 [Archaeoglobales archaeon]